MEIIGIVGILATMMGVVMSLGYYPQAYKIFKNKSSGDVSITSFIIFSLGTLTWFLYGLMINDFQIILGFVFGVFGSWLVLFLCLYYRKTRN